jgi:hypothetical protein
MCFVSMGYTIPAEEMPVNWRIRKEDRDDVGVKNVYWYSNLNAELHIGSQQRVNEPDAPEVYNIMITAGGMLGGTDY